MMPRTGLRVQQSLSIMGSLFQILSGPLDSCSDPIGPSDKEPGCAEQTSLAGTLAL